MAGYNDPFTPGETFDPYAGMTPQVHGGIADQWNTVLANPQTRAAILSAGIAMMQPPHFGDTPMSQFGRAIGTAGESATANQTMDLKERDIASKEYIREARGDAATERASAATARLGAAGASLDLKRTQMEAMNQRQMLGNRIRVSNMYQQYVKQTSDANRNAQLLGQAQVPVKPIQDWIKENPVLAEMGLITPAATSEDPNSPLNDATTVPTAADTTSRPQAPRDPSQRQAGVTYNTPKGVMKWTGTGWVNP